MTTRIRIATGLRPWNAGGLALALSLVVPVAGVRADAPAEVPAQDRPAAAAPTPAMTLGLAECLQLAAQRQPALAAQRASLAAAEDSARALDALWVPTCLARDLPVRRQQAALGVTAAAAGVDRLEHETVYAVTRTFFTVVYARDQERVARGVVDQLAALRQTAQQQLKAGARDATQTDVDRTSVYLDLAETRRLQAAEGVERGLAALQEAIGLEPGCVLDVPAGRLPEPGVRPVREEVIAWALARRADLVQAGTFAQLTGLEVEAQGSSHRLRVDTFARGGDIHSRQVAPTTHDTEYVPGNEPPEMPVTFVGSRPERMQRAGSLNERAAALVEKTRNLIALDADDAFRRWEEASRKVARVSRAAATGERLAGTLRTDYTTRQKVRLEEVINAQVLVSQARSQYNQFLYEEILALADLERVTGGAFCAGLTGPAAPAQPEQGSKEPATGTGTPPLFPQ